MPRPFRKPGPGPLTRRIGLRFKLIDELIEPIEIDARPESERVRNGLRCRALSRLRLLAEPGAQCPVDHLLERQAELAGAPLQQPGQVIVDGERGAHERYRGCTET